MTSVTLTSQGQLTLPVAIRRKLGLKAGDQLEVALDEVSEIITLRAVPELADVRRLAATLVDPDIPPLADPSSYYREHRRS